MRGQPLQADQAAAHAMKDFLLCLTATITPMTGVVLNRGDPAVRRDDYLKAFRYWLGNPDPRLTRILFIENSGADLAEFQREADLSPKQVEIVSTPALWPPEGLHYGYSELLMIDQALDRSQLYPQTTHLIKATGRLLFPDLPKLLDRLPPVFDLAVDTRISLPFRASVSTFVPTQLLIASRRLYDEHLRKGYLDLRADYPKYIEHALYDRIKALPPSGEIILRWPVNCEPVGFAAHAAKRYDAPQRRLITYMRSAMRTIAPGFWI